MNKLQTATRLIIEALHGNPYEEACLIEMGILFMKEKQVPHVCRCGRQSYFIGNGCKYCDWEFKYKPYPICASRLMQALFNKFDCSLKIGYGYDYSVIMIEGYKGNLRWKLLKGNKQAATLEDQSEETLDKIIEIFTK